MVILRIYLVASAYLSLLIASHGLMDPEKLAAWRRSGDAIWGPEALRFHVAGHLLAAIGALILARADFRKREDRAWLLGLLAFGVLLAFSEQGSFFLPIPGILAYLWIVYEYPDKKPS